MREQKYFVTGANGFLGICLCRLLVQSGHRVVALCRSPPSSNLAQLSCQIVRGDLSDQSQLEQQMRNCDGCFHLAGLARQWSRRPNAFQETNVTGTRNVVKAARAARIPRLVFTSTAGVLGFSLNGDPLNESNDSTRTLRSEYERTKLAAELVVLASSSSKFDCIVVNPSRVFGPGPLSESNSVTKLIQNYVFGSWRWIPGDGKSIGNYALVDDVVQGHMLAMEKGEGGRRYLLGGDNLSFNELFKIIAEQSGIERKMLHVPMSLLRFYSQFEAVKSQLFGWQPQLTPAFVAKYANDSPLDLSRAERDLGYEWTPAQVAIKRTIEWLKEMRGEEAQEYAK